VKPQVLLRVIAGIAGAALLMQTMYAMGVESVLAGVGRVGWGFLGILALAGARDVVRTLAWMRTIEGPVPLRFPAAFRARLAGEALNTLVPMGMVLGEPTKASHVGSEIPFATAMRALAVEFAFYSGSLVLLFAAGVSAFVVAKALPVSMQIACVGLIVAIALAVMAVRARAATRPVRDRGTLRRLSDLVLGFGDRHPEHVRPIVLLEIAYHVIGVAEVYVTLLLIGPFRPTLASALVLETVSRAVTMVFKIVPMRVGVDEMGSSIFASQLQLGVATGLTLALIRKLRLLCWSAVGLALLIRRPRRIAPIVAVREPLLFGLFFSVLLAGTPVHAAPAQDATATLGGTVLVGDPSGSLLAVPGVTPTCPSGDPRVEISNEEGAPEFGLSTGAVTTIETQKRGAAWHTTVNDLEPRIRRRGGEFRGIESFTARVTVGGPVVAGKLTILESAQYDYSQTRVFGLPPFESDTKVQSFESFTAADLTINDRHRLTASTMVSPRKTTYNDQDRTSRRVEWLTAYSFAPRGPAHLFKVGGGARRETFDGVSRNRPVEIVGADGTLRQAMTFNGCKRAS
jgi:hypothetical protein